MKFLIASDIHGSEYYCRKLVDRIEEEKCECILLLGDILYHGPRNDLPKEYNPKGVISLLDGLSHKILAVRGNCDTEVDQMVLSFPILAEYSVVCDENRLMFLTHGHNIPESIKAGGNIILSGHTHVPVCIEEDGYTQINPGSVSIPKENSPHSYMTYENGTFLWKDVETGEVYKEYKI
ncbi:MAG: phosphodiesterase [Ruminococcaceae bacterium]|nr:phosphodiesterase [Oscillospiraceae bacterium]